VAARSTLVPAGLVWAGLALAAIGLSLVLLVGFGAVSRFDAYDYWRG